MRITAPSWLRDYDEDLILHTCPVTVCSHGVDTPLDRFETDTLEDLVSKFVYLGELGDSMVRDLLLIGCRR